MERKSVFGITLMLLLAGMLTVALNIQPVKASGTIYIRADGSVDPPTAPISSVDNVTYYFTDNINDSIVVERNNIIIDGNGYTLKGSGIGYGFHLPGINNSTVKNVNIQNFSRGVYVNSSSFITLSQNIITNNGDYGIYLRDSANTSVYGNTIANNYDGVLVFSNSSNNIISGNTIANNDYCGVVLYSSSNNIVSRNHIAENNYGIFLERSSNNNCIYNNNFLSNAHQVYIDNSVNAWDDGYPSGGNYWSDYTERYPDAEELDGWGLWNTPYVIDENNQDNYPLMHPYGSIRNLDTNLTYLTIQSAINAPETLNGHTIFVRSRVYYEHIVVNKTVSIIGENKETTIIDGNGTGTVLTITANNVNIRGFTIQNRGMGPVPGYCGIHLDGSTGTVIYNNIIKANHVYGIYISHSYNSTLTSNNLTANHYWGVCFSSSYDNVLINNSITNSERGVRFDFSSHHNILTNNKIMRNFLYGVELVNYSYNNTLVGNNVTCNGDGVHLYLSHNNTLTGNTLMENFCGISLEHAYDNRIFHNNFANNTWLQVNIIEATNNIWDNDYPSGGNYWSDYVGVDVKHSPGQDLHGSDGIGDTPYVIDAENVDHYPLMNPYGAPPPPTYNLTITATVGGTTDPDPETYGYTANSSVQVTAIPEAGYSFDYWELDSVNADSANPYTVLMDKDHTLKAVFELIPPPLSTSINPLSASINVGESLTFTSTATGGTPPYSYQWYLNGAPVSGANSSSWAFTSTSSGIYYVYLKVTDAKGNTTQSETARITVAAVPVGGYSLPIQVHTKAKPVIPYIALIAVLTALFIKIKRKTRRKR